MKQIRWVYTGLTVVLAAGIFIFAGNVQAAEQGFACAPKVTLDADTAGKVMLEDFSCFFKRYEGAQALHFKVGVKNVSETPQRYRVNIFLDNGKAVGGLIPRTTKKGLVEPEQSASFVYPVTGMTEKPNEIMLIIKTSGQ